MNDPDDSGGATNAGITQRTYDKFRKTRGLSVQPVIRIAREEVEEIYKEGYWKASRAAFLAWPLNLAVFDTAVNFGPGRSNQFVAKALGLKASTKWSPEASNRIHGADPCELALKIVEQRIAWRHKRVAEKPSQQKFLKGWLRRDEALRKEIEKA